MHDVMAPPGDLLLFAVGACLLLAAGAWRGVARRRVVAAVRSALRARDPAVRRAGIAIATQRGLSRHSRALLELAEFEPEPAVSVALARAVARNRWEPATDPGVVRLRLWAEQRIQDVPWPHGSGVDSDVDAGESLSEEPSAFYETPRVGDTGAELKRDSDDNRSASEGDTRAANELTVHTLPGSVGIAARIDAAIVETFRRARSQRVRTALDCAPPPRATAVDSEKPVGQLDNLPVMEWIDRVTRLGLDAPTSASATEGRAS